MECIQVTIQQGIQMIKNMNKTSSSYKTIFIHAYDEC